RVERIDDGVALDVDRRRIVRAATGEKSLRADRVVIAGREAARVAHREIGHRRAAEHAVVDVVVAGACPVRHPLGTLLETGLPDPDVEGIEVAEGDAGLRVAKELIPPDARFREAVPLEAAVNAVFD